MTVGTALAGLRLDGRAVHLLWLAVAAVDAVVLFLIWRSKEQETPSNFAPAPVRLTKRRDDSTSRVPAWALPLALAIGALAWFGVIRT